MKKFFLLLIVSLILTTGCGSGGANEEQPLRIGVLPIEDSLPLFVAEAENIFVENGVDVELVSFNSARDRDMALQAGEIDGEVADILAAALLEKSEVDVSIISLTLGTIPQEGRFALLTSPNSGLDSLAKVDSLSVAISENTIIEYVLDQLIEVGSINKEKVDKVSIPRIPERLQLLLADKIDAAVLPDPLASLAEAKGAHVILDDTKINDNISQVVVLFTKDTVQENAGAVTKMIDAYDQAVEIFNANPDSYRQLFIEKARVPQDIQNSYQAPKFSPAQVPAQADVDRLLNWAKAKNLIPGGISYEQLIDNSFVKE
ncbi:MetQ/NlpA family ABC transporter substrate-binding protein [Metallumcola ferriviriculae]|uniref:MetQ/NlpA family ABC transporter substrate-binding protein n=1 Tax=Metallumcola ferriviriculae TaxID=3039180 RepID=A0AAU0UQ62_9FIRM|nr:MetQ/NlpA family ABC transporter substrate-binding protein [Desulfitibacteraceae bacterium MK1]